MLKRLAIRLALIAIILFVVGYGMLLFFSRTEYPVKFGVSFSAEYAESLGLDSKKMYKEMLTDLKPKYIRLSVPWSRVEMKKGVYAFDGVDYFMDEAAKSNVKVILAFGQKVPRWPECYIPEWIKTTPVSEQRKELFSYIESVVKRYEKHPALEYWQVENEPFIKFEFGECGTFDETSVKKEVEFVRTLDSTHKVVMTDSGELSTWQKASDVGDVLGVTLYRVVRTPGGMVWSYNWVPASVYKLRAAFLGKTTDNFFVSELQAEPWFTGGTPANTDIGVQEQTSSLSQISNNISYAKHIGASRAYLWGVEWWYWMKTKQNNPGYWDRAKEALKE